MDAVPKYRKGGMRVAGGEMGRVVGWWRGRTGQGKAGLCLRAGAEAVLGSPSLPSPAGTPGEAAQAEAAQQRAPGVLPTQP